MEAELHHRSASVMTGTKPGPIAREAVETQPHLTTSKPMEQELRLGIAISIMERQQRNAREMMVTVSHRTASMCTGTDPPFTASKLILILSAHIHVFGASSSQSQRKDRTLQAGDIDPQTDSLRALNLSVHPQTPESRRHLFPSSNTQDRASEQLSSDDESPRLVVLGSRSARHNGSEDPPRAELIISPARYGFGGSYPQEGQG